MMYTNRFDKKCYQTLLTLLATIPFATAGIACLANPCLHGICIDDVNSTYACYCIDGYTGVQCQTNWDECWSNPCQNGGTCVDGVATYNCTCPEGFIGDNCETNYNECESNPCLNNGTCIDMTNEYVCHCVSGFSGPHCEVDVAVCNATEEVRCYNGGECIEGPGFKFYCKCLAGWTGPNCEEQIDECKSNPCRNGGVCIDAYADYMCACTYGFTGKSCEVQIEFCDENSCYNGALCVVEDGERICYCVPDYHGERCEFQYDECLLGPRCMNGGSCIDGVDNFTCSCPPRLTGTLCECLILDDGSYNCDYVKSTLTPDIDEFEITTYHSELTTSGNVSITDVTKQTSTSSEISTITYWTLSTEPNIDTVTNFTTLDSNFVTNPWPTDEISKPTMTTEKPKLDTTTSYETVLENSTTTLEIPSNITPVNDSSVEFSTECIESCSQMNITTILPTNKTETSSTSTDLSTMLSFSPTKSESPETIHTESSIKETTVSSGTAVEDISSWYETTGTPSIKTTDSVSQPATPQIDTTTEKMFTETPTDNITFASTSPTYSVTEITEPTIDATSHLFPTTATECTDNTCNNHGICHNSFHGFRCQCTFNYGGRFCEDKISIRSAAFDGSSYIVHQIKNSTTIDIEFSAKTLITDGQIMHVDIAKGVYMELHMKLGLLKFQFSCGYQTMLLSELKTYVNKGFLMKIETRLDLYMKEQHCNATLRLNDTLAMSGGQIANITSLNHNTTIYFGNSITNNYTENKPFIGCIKDLSINGEAREVFGDALDAAEVAECSSLSCLSGPCLNGGSCSDRGDTFMCSCANGWMGNSCNQSVCEHNPCRSGGSCVPHPGSGFLCLCPYGRHGIFCEYNVEISRPSLAPITSGKSSYVIYPITPAAMNSDRFDLRLRFQTTDMDQIALLAFVGQNGRHDSRSQHIALTFVKGYIMLTWNMGSGPRRVFTARAARRGPHSVRVWRRGRSAGLTLDARHNVSGNAPSPTNRNNITLLPYLYVGGYPSDDFRDLPHDLPLHGGWNGCVWDVSGQSVAAKAVGGRGVGQCGVSQCSAKSCGAPRGVCIHSSATYGCICNEGWFGATCNSQRGPCDPKTTQCHGSCTLTLDGSECDCPYGKSGLKCDQDLVPIDIQFSGTRSYLTLNPRSISSVSLALEAEIKPMKERGLILYIETPHFYTALSIQGGLLEYRWIDRVSGVSSLVRSGAVVSTRQWHGVRAGRYGARLYVWLDGALATEPLRAHAYPHTASDATIHIGGAKDLSTLPFDVMSGPPESFTGCFRKFHVNNIPLPLEPQNIKEGQNIGACDGAACGGAGARCRRGACSPALCQGACARGRCVCAAGTAGDRCDARINVTVPQFNGAALLSLSRSRAGRSGQLSAPRPPSRLALNFTTSEPDGLLLWIYMVNVLAFEGHNYIGLGLEHGYLKLAWSLHCNSSFSRTDESLPVHPQSETRLVQAGFMADGDWHAIILTLDGFLTLTVDQMLYVEEQCLIQRQNDLEVLLGGVSDGDAVIRKLFPLNFKGCIDRISTTPDSYLTNYTDVYSENVLTCQLFAPT